MKRRRSMESTEEKGRSRGKKKEEEVLGSTYGWESVDSTEFGNSRSTAYSSSGLLLHSFLSSSEPVTITLSTSP